MFVRNLRYAIRSLARSPSFAITVVLTLALGIGANTAIFSLVNALLLRPIPVAHPEQLVEMGDPRRTSGFSSGSPRERTGVKGSSKFCVSFLQVPSG